VLQRYLVPRDEIDRQIRSIRQDAYEMFRTMSDEHAPAHGLQRFLQNLSLEVYRVEPGSAVIGKTLELSGVRDTSGATVAAIQRPDSDVIVNPAGTDTFAAADIVLLLGKPEQLSRAAALFRGVGTAE
jgi:CPA2 family monovalent cation:H+ antiporter-2